MSATDAAGKSRGGRVLLIASLALNLFLVGLIVGGIMSGVRTFRERGPGFGLSAMEMREVADMLADETRAKFRESMRDSFPELRQAFRDARQARDGVSEALAAEPFDIDALEDAFATARAADDKVWTLSTGAFTKFVGELDEAEREELVEAIKKRRDFRRSRRDDRPGPPPDFDRPLPDGPPPLEPPEPQE